MLKTHQTILVLRLPINHPHVLNPDTQTGNTFQLPAQTPASPKAGGGASPGFHNVNGHRCCSGNQTADHTGTEVTKDVIVEISCGHQTQHGQPLCVCEGEGRGGGDMFT